MIDGKHRHSLLFLAIFVAFWVAFAIFYGIDQSNKKAGDLPRIIKRGVLRVCGEEDLFSYYQDDKGLHGFHYELAKAFSDRFNLDLVYIRESNFNYRLKLLKSGKCDILSGPLPVIAELRKTLAYTEPLYISKLVLVQRTKGNNNGKSPIRDQLLLSEKKITIVEHSPYILRLHNLANEISDSIHIREFLGLNNQDLIEAVSKGLINFVACDKYVAHAYLKKYPNIDIQTSLGFSQYQAWAVRPEKQTLLDSLNQFITEYKKSPVYTRLLKKYSK